MKRILQNLFCRWKTGVTLSPQAHVHRVDFGPNCAVGKGGGVFASTVGHSTYFGQNTRVVFARIGAFCSIGDNVRVCLGNHPSKVIVSTHPAFYSLDGNCRSSFVEEQLFEEHVFIDESKKYVAEIGSDVWIGNGVSVMDGLRIGHGAIIATGAVVTRDVEPYSIVGGVPAKHIRYRFSQEQREFLLALRWWEKGDEWLRKTAHLFSDIEVLMAANLPE